MKFKCKKYFIIIGLVFILLPINSSALSGSVSISCPKVTLNPDEVINCSISGNSSDFVAAVSAKLSSTGNIQIFNITTPSIWQGNGSDGSIELYTDENKNGKFLIANFTVKALHEGTGVINVNNVSFTDESFSENAVSSEVLNIVIQKQSINADNTSTSIPTQYPNDENIPNESIDDEDNQLEEKNDKYNRMLFIGIILVTSGIILVIISFKSFVRK